MAEEKYLIFDSSSLINMTTNGLLEILTELKEDFKGEFLITNAVRYESIDHPLKISRFEWGALRIKQLLDTGVLELAEEFVNKRELQKETQKVLSMANNTFFSQGKAIHIIDEGEAEAIALSIVLNRQEIENRVVIDERTARILCENPENLLKIFESKLHLPVKAERKNFNYFKEISVIRSTELIYIADKRGLLKIKDRKALEAVLYALKFGGCSITEKEIQVLERS